MSEHPAIAFERELLTAGCRKNGRRLSELIAADFIEIGASGRVWRKADIVQDLPSIPDLANYEFTLLELREVGSDHVLLLYSLRDGGSRVSLRSSLWRRQDRWQMVFHQGTAVGE